MGGFLRDFYLSRLFSVKCTKHNRQIDIDFCVEADIYPIVKELAKRTGAKCIVLDKKERSRRVIFKLKETLYTYDFTLLRGRDFYEDLSLRDFSINTLAVNVQDKKMRVIDYFGGRNDLKRRIIRVIKEEVLIDDPLRILRGFAFAANYGFRLDRKTLKAMVKSRGFLKDVSGERINEELFKIFSSPVSYMAVKQMDDLRFLDEIIPYIDTARGVRQGG